MAFLADSTIEIRPGAGSDTNGGCFAEASGGTNYSLQNVAQLALTDVVAAGTTTLTSVVGGFTVAMIGNTIYLAGGSGSLAGTRRRITAVATSNSMTVDANVATGTGITGKVGGALATIGGLGEFWAAHFVNGMRAWIKTGTDTLSSGTANVSGGRFSIANTNLFIAGYNAVRGDLNNAFGSASRPTIDFGAQTLVTAFTLSDRALLANLIFDGQNGASNMGAISTASPIINCSAIDCPTGFTCANIYYCSTLACGTGISANAGRVCGCVTIDSTVVGFNFGNQVLLINSVSINDAIAVIAAGVGIAIVNFTGHEAAGDCVNSANFMNIYMNSLFTSNVGDAIDFTNTTTAPTTFLGINNAFRGNGAVYETTPPSAQITGSITVTSDPYTNEATDDLSPNNVADGGALLRNAGIDAFGQTDNRDVGAVQHADPVVSGATIRAHRGSKFQRLA